MTARQLDEMPTSEPMRPRKNRKMRKQVARDR
jgi:hypothetical protein